MTIIKALGCFLLAAVFELSGAYLIWQWWRNQRPLWLAAAAAAILVLYGIVNTFQSANFGRSYAAYGGVFICMALLWGWQIDGNKPDVYDLTGAGLCLVGMSVIMFAPR
jgi:small multidrug resistance family-3 protein